jgi:hypothetical protein
MKANEYQLMVQCVEEGYKYGYHRAHKHTDNPTPEQIATAVQEAIINAMCEWFMFEDSRRD